MRRPTNCQVLFSLVTTSIRMIFMKNKLLRLILTSEGWSQVKRLGSEKKCAFFPFELVKRSFDLIFHYRSLRIAPTKN